MNAARRCSVAWRRCAGLAWVVALGFSSLVGRPTLASGQPAADTADWMRAKALADNARGFRLVISLEERRLWAIIGTDTLLDAPVGVASGLSLDYQGRRWKFTTPRGRRAVVAKDSLPEWVPPDWHYYEVASTRGLVVRRLERGQPVTLEDGSRLEVRGPAVGVVDADSVFVPLPPGEEIIYDGFLFVPPLGTLNRRIAGELGKYRIDLGGGFALHGTPYTESIGTAATHGCLRLREDDVAWLYEFVPIGLPVYIY